MSKEIDYGPIKQAIEQDIKVNIGNLHSPAYLYDQRLNLREELKDLLTLQEDVIPVWDVGAGSREAVRELQGSLLQTSIRFLAVDLVDIPDQYGDIQGALKMCNLSEDVPFVQAGVEALPELVQPKAFQLGLYPPYVILASNVLHYPNSYTNTLPMSFDSIHKVLAGSGVVLVYESRQDLYQEYVALLSSRFTDHFDFALRESFYSGEQYLRLIKK